MQLTRKTWLKKKRTAWPDQVIKQQGVHSIVLSAGEKKVYSGNTVHTLKWLTNIQSDKANPKQLAYNGRWYTEGSMLEVQGMNSDGVIN